jgi:hypothetical protein
MLAVSQFTLLAIAVEDGGRHSILRRLRCRGPYMNVLFRVRTLESADTGVFQAMMEGVDQSGTRDFHSRQPEALLMPQDPGLRLAVCNR